MWQCECDCGAAVTVAGKYLRNGDTKSCGCYNKDRTKAMGKNNKIHGDTGTRLWYIWKNMLKRCNKPNDKSYVNYGGRGIKVCPEWQDYKVFKSWAIRSGYSETLTIDRINNDGGYEPQNCRWVTMAVQSRNKRNNVLITYNGEILCLSDWAKKQGFGVDTLWHRLNKYNMGVERALTKDLPKH